MKTWFLIACLFVGGGEHEKGLALYRDGKFAEAAAAFRAAIEAGDDSAEIQYDLALASWRAGDLATAETAAEKYAALAKNARPDLHRGLLGAVRHDEAKALETRADAAATPAAPTVPNAAAPGGAAPPDDPLPILEQALAKANQAKDHFVAGAARGTTPELLRNTERTLRYIDELQKKIDELKKQRDEQKKDDQQKKSDDKKDEKNEKKPDESPKDDKKDEEKQQDQKDQSSKSDDKKDDKKDDKGEPKQSDEPKGDPKDDQPGKDGEQKPEPKPESGKDGQEKQEPKPADQQKPDGSKPETKPGQPRNDAPGESAEAKELSPEQTQRMLEQLKDLDQKLKAIRARAKTSRPPVERDW